MVNPKHSSGELISVFLSICGAGGLVSLRFRSLCLAPASSATPPGFHVVSLCCLICGGNSRLNSGPGRSGGFYSDTRDLAPRGLAPCASSLSLKLQGYNQFLRDTVPSPPLWLFLPETGHLGLPSSSRLVVLFWHLLLASSCGLDNF